MRKMKENYPSVWDVLKEYEKVVMGNWLRLAVRSLGLKVTV